MEKIDFVIIWVDSNDLKWQKTKQQYNPNKTTDSSIIRYRDWDNLKYWFRGVEKFTPWVNNIYFVTCGHVPKWLNINHPKLKLIKHEDYIDSQYLPTFSSHVIEINLHKISDLSEQFVYFNDDMFIIKDMKKTDFFKNGLPCDSAVITPHIPTEDKFADHIILNDMEFINSRFSSKVVLRENFCKWFHIKYGKKVFRTVLFSQYSNFVGFATQHLPSSFLKQTFFDIWNDHDSILDSTNSNRFRSSEDINQWIFKYWQLCTGNFVPRKYNIGKSYVLSNQNEALFDSIIKQKYKMVCINDGKNIDDFEKVKEDLNNAFEKILPDKSSYEK